MKAETDTRDDKSSPNERETTLREKAHDAPGLSPLERMTELTRRIVNVPKSEVDKKRERKH